MPEAPAETDDETVGGDFFFGVEAGAGLNAGFVWPGAFAELPCEPLCDEACCDGDACCVITGHAQFCHVPD